MNGLIITLSTDDRSLCYIGTIVTEIHVVQMLRLYLYLSLSICVCTHTADKEMTCVELSPQFQVDMDYQSATPPAPVAEPAYNPSWTDNIPQPHLYPDLDKEMEGTDYSNTPLVVPTPVPLALQCQLDVNKVSGALLMAVKTAAVLTGKKYKTKLSFGCVCCSHVLQLHCTVSSNIALQTLLANARTCAYTIQLSVNVWRDIFPITMFRL